MCHNVPGDVITTRRAIVVMRGLEDEGRIRPRDTPVIAATALITVFRDNYELVRAHCAARHRSRRRFFLARARTCLFRRCADTKKKKERELVVVVVAVLGGGGGKQMSRREAGRRYTQSRVRRGAYGHARATDVSKAADACFVMLMFSLPTAQQRAAPLCVPRRCMRGGARGRCNSCPSFSPRP